MTLSNKIKNKTNPVVNVFCKHIFCSLYCLRRHILGLNVYDFAHGLIPSEHTIGESHTVYSKGTVVILLKLEAARWRWNMNRRGYINHRVLLKGGRREGEREKWENRAENNKE